MLAPFGSYRAFKEDDGGFCEEFLGREDLTAGFPTSVK
ncbi:hypothetical protein CVCC1112_3151 [Paenarthrobacter nicotinovorans]|nr:hypothetical protein CVCC1112_3151 [Paenarthrobacter nicotinovorans]